MKRLVALSGIFTLILAIIVPSVSAQNQPNAGLNLTLSPTYISLTTDPGKEVSSQFRITNNNATSENLRVSVAKLEVGPNGQPTLADMTPEDAFGKWITIEDDEFSVGGNQSKNVKFTIAPTEDASLGYYYTLLVSRASERGDDDTTSQAVVAGSAAITVLLDVRSPDAKRELHVTKLATDKMFYEYLPTTFTVAIKNSGNVHVIPFGDLFIDSMFHKKISVLPVNPGRGNVLPNSQREFTAVWNDGFAVNQRKVENGVVIKDGKGNEVQETTYDFSKANKFRIGKYTANLIMVYDNGERDVPVEATVTFWILPWRIILGIVTIIVAPALLVFLFMKWKYGKRK